MPKIHGLSQSNPEWHKCRVEVPVPSLPLGGAILPAVLLVLLRLLEVRAGNQELSGEEQEALKLVRPLISDLDKEE